jgi:replicative DNA helicase
MDCALTLEAADEQPAVDSDFIRIWILEEARSTAVWKALDFGLKSWKRRDHDAIRDAMVKACSIGQVDQSFGTNHGETIGERTEDRREGRVRRRHGTGALELDDRLNGGLAAGELGCIFAPPKYGKSLFLQSVAMTEVKQGGRVAYISLEMAESDLTDRTDASISGVPINNLKEKPDFVRSFVDDWYAEAKGTLYIKQLPGYTTSTTDIEQHLQALRVEKDFEPTLLIVDSGDFMRSSGGEEQRHDLMLGGVYSELRGLAVRWKIPCWTASWAKREALSKKEPTMADVGESWRKVGISDLGVAICSSEEELQSGVFRLYVAWCRFTQGNFSLGPYKNDFARGKLLSDESTGEAF